MAEDNDPRRGRDRQVGYSRPPKEHQIKPGEVRNKWGRKGKPRPRTDFMDEPFEICVNGKPRKVTRDEALDYGLFREAVKGNVSAAKEIDRRRKERARSAAGAMADALLPEEKAALDRLLQRRFEDWQASTKGTTATPDDKLELLQAAAREIAPGCKK